jgi:serine/threonine protein kinase
MEFIRSRTSIPIPRILKVYEMGDRNHLVMEMISSGPGNAETDYHQMDPDQVRNFGSELAGYIQQLRSLEPPTEGIIGSVNLDKNHDSRLDGSAWGPFHGIADFQTYLRLGHPLRHWENEPDVMLVHSRPERYSIKFTHADLRPNNILVKDGHITAIIDWEFAGWYPEYWEYTKMHWIPRPLWDKFYEAVEQEAGITKYPEELAAETAIWKRMYPFAYDGPHWTEDDDDAQAENSFT